MPGDGTRGNVNEPSWLAAAGVVTGAAEAAVRLSDAARAPAIAATPRPAAVRARARRRSCLMLIMTGLPCLSSGAGAALPWCRAGVRGRGRAGFTGLTKI